MFSFIGSVSDVVVTVLRTIGLPGLFALMAVESFGIPPLPSEVILPFTGFLVADGTFSFAGATSVAVLGGLLGAYAAYAVGRWWRHRMLGLGIGRLRLEPRHLERVDRYFARHGASAVGLSRMVPVIRSYISYPAGTARMEPIRFGVYTVLGSIPFTVALIYAGTILKSNWTAVSTDLAYLNYPLIALVGFGIVFLALQVAGVWAPGWPPRRVHRAPRPAEPKGETSPPAHPPS
ncbi:MAG TPA: DedA family protein [Thermoplasmata archaeon]|nr:DedA family protein [Thermoplasmata archaeon]